MARALVPNPDKADGQTVEAPSTTLTLSGSGLLGTFTISAYTGPEKKILIPNIGTVSAIDVDNTTFEEFSAPNVTDSNNITMTTNHCESEAAPTLHRKLLNWVWFPVRHCCRTGFVILKS